MTTFENPFYYEQDLKTPIEQQFSPTTSMSTMSTTGTVDADFFLLGDVTSPMFNLSQDTSNWQYVASHLREQIFNSSSISFPAPETYFAKMAQDSGNSSNAAALLSMIDNNATFRFNSDPFCSEDAFAYRRHRSENLLIRMIHCRQMDISQLSLMRLSKGVFVHQKWVSSSPQSSPTLSTIENAFDYNLESTGNISQKIYLNKGNKTKQQSSLF
jgi:hypothetical protein